VFFAMPEYLNDIAREIAENIAVMTALAQSGPRQISEAVTEILSCLRSGGKLIAFGNGGSAADAEHLVAELVGRYRTDRQPLAAVALTTNSASLTAIANDYGFDQVFSRQLQALARSGDIVFAISTSGNSPNVLAALESARKLNLRAIGLTGKTGGKFASLVDVCLHAPSDYTPRIQEVHALIVHLLCAIVENEFVSSARPQAPSKSAAGEVP
jgi:D-sedoheptulose 7-phosphate isomerase